MDRPSKPVLILYFSGVALFVAVGGYLVFTGQMSSYSFLMIALAISALFSLVRFIRR